MFSPVLLAQTEALLAAARAQGVRIATAESCTGGLVAGLLTEVAGSSDVIERGFVTYSNEAKTDLLGVPPGILEAHGAVSQQTAQAMAAGALINSRADLAIAVTGIAGPGGGTADKPVGLVHFAAARADQVFHREYRFGAIGRDQVRLKAVEMALEMLAQLL